MANPKADNPTVPAKRALSLHPGWVFIYLMILIEIVLLARMVVWAVSGGAGLAGTLAGWASDPFVYVFIRPLGTPVWAVGPGKIEVGSVLALLAYAGLGMAMWVLLARGQSVVDLFTARSQAENKDGRQ